MCWMGLHTISEPTRDSATSRILGFFRKLKGALHADEPFTRRLLLLAKEVPEVATSLDIMQERGEATFNFLKNPKILDVAEYSSMTGCKTC